MGTLLGEELRRLRKEKNLTLEEVAKEIGITLQYMSLLEKGERKSVSFDIMANISSFYSVPLDYFAALIKETEDVQQLSDQEIEIWNQINQKVQEEVFFKNGNGLTDWFRSLFK